MKNLRSLMLMAITLLFTFGISRAEEPPSSKTERDEAAIELAGAWFTALVGADAEGALAVSAVPFNFDGNRTIETMPELKARYDEIAEDKGARDIQPTSVQIESSTPEKVVVILMIEDEGIRVDVQPGGTFYVVGFED